MIPDQRLQIGNARAHSAGFACQSCRALLDQRLGIGEAAGMEGERPAVLRGQRGEALHRGALEALIDHLIEREDAALLRALAIGEGDRRRLHAARQRRIGIAARAVAGGAIFRIEPRAARKIGRGRGRERNGIGGEKALPEPRASRSTASGGARRATAASSARASAISCCFRGPFRQRAQTPDDRRGEFPHLLHIRPG